MNLRRLFYSPQVKVESRAAAASVAMLTRGLTTTFSRFGFREATNKGFKSIVWVNRCIDLIGKSFASVPWQIIRDRGSDEPEVLQNHPLGALLNRPNPYQDRQEFYTTMIAHLSLAGNAYWELAMADKVPKYLYPIRPDYMEPIPDPKLYLKGFKFDPQNGSKPITFLPGEIIHYKYIDPLNEYVGVSPLVAAARTIHTENAVITWNSGMLDNNAVPGGVLQVPSTGVDKETRDALVEDLKKGFTGERRFSPMVLWGGMEWKAITLTHRDMEFWRQRLTNKYELCAALGVPPQMVGANEDPTYSNYSTARLSFWEDLIVPLLEWVKNRVNYRLAPYWGDDISVSYDLSDVPAFRESFAALVKTAKDLESMRYPINAINSRLNLGLPNVPWGDVAWVPGNMVPIGEQTPLGVGDEDSTQEEDTLDEEEESTATEEDTEDLGEDTETE